MPNPTLKTSFYLDPDTQAIIAAREVGPGTRSEVIRSCLARYSEICKRDRPQLTDREWARIFEVLDDKWLAQGLSPIHVPATLKDAGEGGLASATGEMFFSELVAIVDAAEVHWAGKARSGGEQ